MVRPMTASDPCFSSLRNAILSGELPPGARLPAERALAAQYAINRVSVRAALSRLATSRLVSVRQGSGYVVRDFRAVAGPELLPGLAALAESAGDVASLARDLLMVRRALARGVLQRLAESPAALPSLGSIASAVQAFAEAAQRGAPPDELAPLDLDILRALLAATGSPVLALCLNPISEALDTLPTLRGAIYVDPSSNVAGWQALLAWLAAPNPEQLEPIVQLLQARDAATIERLKHA